MDLMEKADEALDQFFKLDKRNVKKEEFERFREAAKIAVQVRGQDMKKASAEVHQKLWAIQMFVKDPASREEMARVVAPHLMPKLKARPET